MKASDLRVHFIGGEGEELVGRLNTWLEEQGELQIADVRWALADGAQHGVYITYQVESKERHVGFIAK